MKSLVRYLAEYSPNPFASCKIAAISIFLLFLLFAHFAPSTATLGLYILIDK
jgi:hypothetical protein